MSKVQQTIKCKRCDSLLITIRNNHHGGSPTITPMFGVVENIDVKLAADQPDDNFSDGDWVSANAQLTIQLQCKCCRTTIKAVVDVSG